MPRKPDYDVAIVGYGPTGQACASLLARQGHRVCVLERYPSLYNLPRMVALDGECARMLQAASDVNVALRDSFRSRHYSTYNGDWELLIAIEFTEHSSGWPSMTTTHQPYVEEAMDEAARERGADVRMGRKVVSLHQDDDGVDLVVAPWSRAEGATNRAPGTEEMIRARYVIGSDGANSTVVEALGVEREDFDYRDGWFSVDVVRTGALSDRFEPGSSFVFASPGGNSMAVVPAGTKRMRIEFQIDPDVDNQALLVHDVGYDYIESRLGLTRDEIEITRLALYPFAAKLATEWRRGRVFLAGDAAHLMPPFLGQGGNSGMRDAVALAWRLDLTLRGLVDQTLLDTYEVERYPHARHFVISSVEHGRVATERDPVKAAARDALLLSGEAPPPEPPPAPVSGGVLLREAGGQLSTLAGSLAPQGWVRHNGRTGRFDDVVGWGFHLVARDRDPLELLTDDQRRLLASINGHAVGVSAQERPGLAWDINWTYERLFDSNGVEAFLMRPDFYIFGATTSIDGVPSLLDALGRQLMLTGEAGR